VEVAGHVNQGPIQIGFKDQQGGPQCLWKSTIYYSSRYNHLGVKIIQLYKHKYSDRGLMESNLSWPNNSFMHNIHVSSFAYWYVLDIVFIIEL
jgi:hypothetical protein